MSQATLFDIGASVAQEPQPPKAPRKKDDGIEREARLSTCGTYRYDLGRFWDRDKAFGLFLMLNPSTADANKDDPTIISCIKRARAWDWGGFFVCNLFAFRSPHPKDLVEAVAKGIDPIGPDNDHHIRCNATAALASEGQVVAAWGDSYDFAWVGGALKDRNRVVLDMILQHADVMCIGKTKSGAPIHPGARGRSRVPEGTPFAIFASKTT